MSETAIFNATGQVFTYNPTVRNWVPSSNVPATLQMYYNSSAGTYRVIGRAGDDPNNFLINFAVKSEVVYSRPSEVFHQFTDQRTHFGINFTSKQDADTFGNGFEKVLASIKGGVPPPMMKPAAPPQQPAPQRPVSTTIAKPSAPAAPAAPTPPAAPAAPAPPAPPAPPKPPGPPPPPPAAKSSAASGRGALLGSIENFSKSGLKKTVTVDKSGPLVGNNNAAASTPASGGSTPASGGSTPAASTPKVSGGGGGGDLMAEVMAKRAKMKAAAAQPKEESSAPAPAPTPVRESPAPTPSFNKPSSVAQSFNKPSKPAPAKPASSPSSTASPPSTVANEDLQSLKEEILAEVRKELRAMKDEILEAIRNK